MTKDEAAQKIKEHLTSDLLRPKYRKRVIDGAHFTTGHCYVASEAFHHLTGSEMSQWKPCSVLHEGEVHWYLKNKLTGEIMDITSDQFNTPVPYQNGRYRAFLTKFPSHRCQILMGRILGYNPNRNVGKQKCL